VARLPARRCYDLIAQAARELSCLVLANGNVHGPDQAVDLLARTGARGLMIGPGIRNPWLFDKSAATTRRDGHRCPRDGKFWLHPRTVGAEVTPGVLSPRKCNG